MMLIAGGAYVALAPEPQERTRQGATRASAVAPDVVPARNQSSHIEVKIVGASADSGKPCHEQTWPYIEQRCLSPAKDAEPNREGAQPLGIRNVLLGVKAPDMVAARDPEIAARPMPPAAVATETPAADNVSSPEPEKVAGNAAKVAENVPLPRARPDTAVAGLPYGYEDDEEAESFSPPPAPLSQAERRRLEREWRRMERAERRAFNDRAWRHEVHRDYRTEREIRHALDRLIRHFR